MYNEIGSEFWSSDIESGRGICELLPQGFSHIFVLSGRTALEIAIDAALKKSHNVKKAYLPSYCCHTMIEPFARHGLEVIFYDVSIENGKAVRYFDDKNDCDIVLLMDYFGYSMPHTSELMAEQKYLGKTVIYDATHSLFRTNNDFSKCDYVFGSFRKWFGVNAGFVSAKGNELGTVQLIPSDIYTSMRNHAFDLKAEYINGKCKDKETFLNMFGLAEKMLEKDYLRYLPDDRSVLKLQTANVDFIRQRRRENASKLIGLLEDIDDVDIPFGKIRNNDCPLFVPITLKEGKRNAVRKQLIDNNIYLPVHWPISEWHRLTENTAYIYLNELSCVTDQRYDFKDMEHLYTVLRGCF